MAVENLKFYIEVGVMSVLAISMILIIFLLISKNSSISMLKSQIASFRNKTELEIELNKKMSFFYSLTSNAVYIGLLGTTLGIMVTLSNLGSQQSNDNNALIASLSIPLLSTAVSIIVAIIGTFCYNFVVAKMEETLKYWDIHHGHDQKAC